MAETIVICGYGVGISDAVARRFAKQGFRVAIVARNAERLNGAAEALKKEGIDAKAFPADLSDPEAVKKLISDVRASFGPIKVIHWNAYSGGAGDLKTASTAELQSILGVTVFGLVAALQASLTDLKDQAGALLVTGGGFAFYDPNVDSAVVQWGASGLAIGKAAQHKAVGVLSKALAADGIYVGEVVVTGLVKGTAWDTGNATLEASTIAQKFWDLYQARDTTSVTL